jgi:hypothetical protein
VTVLLLVTVVWVAWSAWRTANALRSVQSSHGRLADDVRAEDWDAAERSAQALASDATAARDAASAIPMRLLSRLPVVGDDVSAVRTTAAAADIASAGAAPLIMH